MVVSVDKQFWDWWEKDWSWDGLSDELKSYWKEEEACLINFGGRSWTRFHLPMYDEVGNLSPKDPSYEGDGKWSDSDFSKLDRDILAKMEVVPNGQGSVPEPTHALLNGVVVPAAIRLRQVHVVNSVDFSDARFERMVSFENTTFLGDFFLERSFFRFGTFFSNCSFNQSAVLSEVWFDKSCRFQKCNFHKGADFSVAYFKEEAEFLGSKFELDADFQFCRFVGNSIFTEVRFKRQLNMAFVHFFSLSVWANTSFQGLAKFDKTEFLEWASFRATGGNGKVSEEEGSFQEVSFHDAIFHKEVDFENRAFLSRTSFVRTVFGGLPNFHGASLHPNTTFERAKFRHTRINSNEIMRRRQEEEERLRSDRGQSHTEASTNAYRIVSDEVDNEAAQMESAYRTLKQHMGDIRNRNDEARFFKYELRARRCRKFEVGRVEILLSRAYEITSDYGESLSLPTIFLAVMWATFAFFYLCWADVVGLTHQCNEFQSFHSTMIFSLEPIFRPFNIWSIAPEDVRLFKSMDCSGNPGDSIFLKLLASLQSVGALTLVGMFLIAIGRRFKIR